MQPTWIKLIIVIILGMAFVLSLFHSVTITVAWWKGALDAGLWEWLWIGLLPVWLYVYFRYYSAFRTGCRACLPPDQLSSARCDNRRGME